MDRNQVLATGIFFVIIAVIMLGSCTTSLGKSIPTKVSELYTIESDENMASGRLRTYISNEPPLPTVDNLRAKLGRPYDMTDLTQWQADTTRPIILLYDDYVVSVQGIDGGRSRVEVTNHETAYNRHTPHFIYYWGPTVRRGSIFPSGPKRVQDGGIGGLGGK